MRVLSKIALSVIFSAAGATAWSASGSNVKNWTPPNHKIYAQTISDRIMASHPELLSVTFHGVPPGKTGLYTMFAGSYPERIGNPDDPDDIDVITKGITIIDPRWHRTQDSKKKFVVQLPLRDALGENVGLLVLAFKNDQNPSNSGKLEEKFFHKSAVIRDGLQKHIPSYAALFKAAK
ncbi:MAG: hypothetical protein M3Y93_00985 [Pseudomonadota bacterium]|nr:hypothetical protein [Pseudomonadota bacterium]